MRGDKMKDISFLKEKAKEIPNLLDGTGPKTCLYIVSLPKHNFTLFYHFILFFSK